MSHDSGASSFVRQLDECLVKMNRRQIKIALPSNSVPGIQYDLARIDGCYFYDFTARNLKNYMELTRGWQCKFPVPPLSSINALLNYHLNRGVRGAIESSRGVVFQSELSKAMHERFIGRVNKPDTVILNGAKPVSPPSVGNPFKGVVWLAITASFRPHKRLLEALALLRYLNELGEATFKLAVFGKIDAITQRYLREINTDGVAFYGAVSRTELETFYVESRPIGLSPSLFDPCPNSVVEMMACSVPVLSTSVSGAAEIVGGHPEFIVPETIDLDYLEQQTPEGIPRIDIEEWAKKVLCLHRNYQSMSEKAYEVFMTSLDIEVVTEKYSNFAESL